MTSSRPRNHKHGDPSPAAVWAVNLSVKAKLYTLTNLNLKKFVSNFDRSQDAGGAGFGVVMRDRFVFPAPAPAARMLIGESTQLYLQFIILLLLPPSQLSAASAVTRLVT